MDEITFEDLPLAEGIQRALRDRKYTTPSPIQAQAIPHLIEGRDLLGSAQTGTGKTAAFALPILHNIAKHRKPLIPYQVRVLVLAPTRELAEQISKSFQSYGKHLRFRQAAVYGGVSQHPQVRALSKGVDILVATPGRLLDLKEQGRIKLEKLEVFVVDEADRMLDMGFIPDIKRIVAEIPQERQSIFFSATLSASIRDLAGTILNDPVCITITPTQTTAEKIEQCVCFLDGQDKKKLLTHVMAEQEAARPGEKNLTLVFSRTKHSANRLAESLVRSDIRADAIHGDKSQGARQNALDKFRKGKTQVLVATDVAARGIDVKGISLVVNYDIPNEAESYVHRIGRTARAGAEGKAISFCAPDEFKYLSAIERFIGQTIPLFEAHPYHDEALVSRYARGKASKKRAKQGAGRRNGKGKKFSHRGGERKKADSSSSGKRPRPQSRNSRNKKSSNGYAPAKKRRSR